MYALIPLIGELHETEWEFYRERTFNAHCCTGAEDTGVTQYCVTENPSSEKHLCGYSIFHSLRMVPKNNDNKDNSPNRNYGK